MGPAHNFSIKYKLILLVVWISGLYNLIFLCTHTHTHICTLPHTKTHTHTHTRTHAHTHTDTHAHSHTLKHIHTHKEEKNIDVWLCEKDGTTKFTIFHPLKMFGTVYSQGGSRMGVN